MLLLFSATAFC